MAGSDDIALLAQDLSLAFDTGAVLEGFSIEISGGQKILMTGPSGCGKSTLLKCFLGLVVPKSGSIAVAGQPLTPATVWSLRRQIAYVTQEPDLGLGNVRQIVERPFHYRANTHLPNYFERLNELMDLFGLGSDLRDKDVSRLSGGEKQRIALTVAMTLDRPILLLDEPTSALDVRSRRTLSQYLQSRTDLTALVVTHDTGNFTFADNIVHLQARVAGDSE
ncbi:MAG: ABC transporter ATP-binding protein [Phycisphaerae bacterium]|nr:ABC transporter ATP-binding protein [Phycisphaerae bacterium]